MRLTTKGRFAVTAMIDLALRSNNGPVALAAISQRQQISLSYLEQLFGKLRRHELVESTRGPGGGYSLGRKSDEITVADIIVAVDEPIDATGCAGKENCMGEDAGRCMTHDLWASLNQKMIEYLDSISLKKLVDAGAKSVSAYVTHGVLSGGAVGRVSSSPLKELVITDSIRATEGVRVTEKIRVLSVAQLIGEAISRISSESSVSSLFD